jgi:hypothetical protein
MRLNGEAATADPPAATLSPLSAAQRCAADTLTIVFGFAELKEMARAARTCKAWLAAAAKEKPRRLTRKIGPGRADRLAAVCASSSPFKKHISRVVCSEYFSSLGLSELSALSRLPELTALEVEPDAEDLKRLMDEESEGALAEVKAAFPPNLRDLRLWANEEHPAQVWQLLLDALPAMKGLERLTLARDDDEPDPSPALSLEPLLQLSRLTHLTWHIGRLTVSQLQIIKQIATLQFLHPGLAGWSAAQLSALCRPPHRLQQLQDLKLYGADQFEMADLVSLPALTSLENVFTAGAFAFLPRFTRLQRLSVSMDSDDDPDQQALGEDSALLVSAVSACSALTDLTIRSGECSESFGSQLMQAVPRLRTLGFSFCSLLSLRFLRHAPNLKNLSLHLCKHVRSGHVTGLGSFAPQLESLTVEYCDGLLLDEAEVQMLTPPDAIGLPHLRELLYRPVYWM